MLPTCRMGESKLVKPCQTMPELADRRMSASELGRADSCIHAVSINNRRTVCDNLNNLAFLCSPHGPSVPLPHSDPATDIK